MKPVRVRFAPSPTGGLHIGGVRTALYNYLLAKQTGGTFIIRIEDTDQTRYVEGAEEYIIEALRWVGIEADESPEKGGKYAPYRQSERKHIYQEYVKKLIENGSAYYAFDTEEELEAMRQRLEAAKAKNTSYNMVSRMQMKNSLTLPADEVEKRLQSGEPYVIRLKVPAKQTIRFKDLIRGWVAVESATLDDKVLLKSDGMPTYHLANVVDDHLMEITHVIRGEEWLPSAPFHVLLYEMFGWQHPEFAHLPLILKPDLKDAKGKIIQENHGKLSKRDAEAMGFPIFPLTWQGSIGYREAGYLPEAIVNFLALLGWNPGTNQEIFSMQELIQLFSIERIGKSGSKFEIEKAKWFNQQYLRMKTGKELLKYLTEGLQKVGINYSKYNEEQLAAICDIMKERATFPDDIWREARYFFEKPTHFDENVIKQKWNEQTAEVIASLKEKFVQESNFSGEKAKEILHQEAEKRGLKLGQVMPVLRVALTGVGAGPDLSAIMQILGKNEVVERLENALKSIAVSQ
ncbi:MAG: glutamate--tRNA ligase [Raineya sp.]|nr:glutamate--tRNA ligase [Raineya sp.]MDW8296959.1 glutamate--tRNA ligase [Raineya sp.]